MPESGQATVEHVGLVTLAALLFAALAVATPVGGVGGDIAATIGGVFGRDSPSSAAAEPAQADTWAERRALVDGYMGAPLDEFLAYRESPGRDPGLDYSTDLCSAPLVGSTGASFDFTEPCLRHDFGYRNYDRLGIFSGAKDAVDRRFLADMNDHCEARLRGDRGRCHVWARVFYEAVRRLGHLSGHGGEADLSRAGRGSARRRRRRRR
jgi:hypothetical protein